MTSLEQVKKLEYQNSVLGATSRVNLQVGSKQGQGNAEKERDELLQKVQKLLKRNEQLRETQSSSNDTLLDLRKLLDFKGIEKDEELRYYHTETVKLKEEQSRLASCLNAIHGQGDHLTRCQLYWKQFL